MTDLIKDLRREIDQDTEKKINQIFQDAELEISKIQKSINHNTLETGKETDQNLGEMFQKKLSRMQISLKLEYKNKMEEIINQVIEESFSLLLDMRNKKDENYKEIFNLLCWQAIEALGSGDLTIEIDPKDDKLIQIDEIKKKIDLNNLEDINISINQNLSLEYGGIIAKKGNITVDNTFQSIYNRRKDKIRNEVYQILFKD